MATKWDYVAGELVMFKATRPCYLHGCRYRRGACVFIALTHDYPLSQQLSARGQRGPWDVDGYTSRHLRSLGNVVTP